MKKLYRASLSGVLLLLSACWSFGTYELPEQARHLELQTCQSKSDTSQGLEWTLTYLGPSPALSTSKTAWNSHLRYVYPFTRHTQLFELNLKNKSRQTLWLEPDQVLLQFSNRVQKPLDMSFFELAWPSGAVRSEAELLDRSLAISEIYARLLTTRPVLPGESVTGVLAFLSFAEVPQHLQLNNWRWGQSTVSKDFCLEQATEPSSVASDAL